MSVYNKIYVKTELFANKIDGTDLTTTDWAFLGSVDQDLAKSDDVEFNGINAGIVKVTDTLTISKPMVLDVSGEPIALIDDPNPVNSSISIFNTSSSSFLATLPDASISKGKSFIIYLSVAGNDLIITASGSDTISNGVDTTLLIDTQYQRITFVSTGLSNWLIM
jgi:hypothetical protein